MGDYSTTVDVLIAPGLLEALGLEIILPTNSKITSTAGKEGSLID